MPTSRHYLPLHRTPPVENDHSDDDGGGDDNGSCYSTDNDSDIGATAISITALVVRAATDSICV